jgi:hypothetical protein
VTAVAQFTFCPRQYQLERTHGLPLMVLAASAGGGRALGIATHEVLAEEEYGPVSTEAANLAEVFRASELGRRAARASRVEREFDFLLAVEDVVLRGQIDLWFEEGGELVLVDYKTDLVTPGEEEARAGRYAAQVQLYSLALERLTGRLPDRAVLHFLQTDCQVDVPLDSADEARGAVAGFRLAQNTGVFPLREGPHCSSCAFFAGLCPVGGGAETAIGDR